MKKIIYLFFFVLFSITVFGDTYYLKDHVDSGTYTASLNMVGCGGSCPNNAYASVLSSFTASSSYDLWLMGYWLARTGNVGDRGVTVCIYNMTADVIKSQIACSNAISTNTFSTTAGWVNFTFNSSASIISGQQYGFTFESNYVNQTNASSIFWYYDTSVGQKRRWVNQSVVSPLVNSVTISYDGSPFRAYNKTVTSPVNFTINTTQPGSYYQNWIYVEVNNLSAGTNTNITLWKSNVLIASNYTSTFPFQMNYTGLAYGAYILNATNTSQSFSINLNFSKNLFGTTKYNNGTSVVSSIVLVNQNINVSYFTGSNSSGNWNYTTYTQGNYSIFAYLNSSINGVIKSFVSVT